MQKIGMIGLGHMGKPMALRLAAAGANLSVYDLSKAAYPDLTEAGIHCAERLESVFKDAEILITMLQSGEQVRSIYLGDKGAFKELPRGSLCIDCSTIDLENARDLANLAKKAGFAMVDAPVSGGVKGAAAGTLTFMMGGDLQAIEAAKAVLQPLGQAFIHAGPSGSGQIAKICNNMLLGINMVGVSEAFNLGKALGLAPEILFEIASKSSGQSWAMTSYCPVPDLVPTSPANFDYQPGFSAAMMLKDLRLSQAAAAMAKVATPLGAEAAALYALFVAQGQEARDFSAIIQFLAGQNST